MRHPRWILPLSMLALAGCARSDRAARATAGPAQPAAAQPLAASAAGLTRVEDPAQVCMVNDQYMGKPQIPVVVGSKKYFGCCAMCEAKLETNERTRSAVDPTTGRAVDKASAVLARNGAGKIFYFESEETFRRYRP